MSESLHLRHIMQKFIEGLDCEIDKREAWPDEIRFDFLILKCKILEVGAEMCRMEKLISGDITSEEFMAEGV